MDYQFDFEKLEVYKRSLNFVKEIFNLLQKSSREIQFSLGDQLRRASLSIVNNIAEGSAKNSIKERRQFYSFALNSLRECVPMIDLCLTLSICDKNKHDFLRNECVIIGKMLWKLIKSLEVKK